MKEREGGPNQGNPELTRKPIQSKLETGDIFMANGPDQGGDTPRPVDPQEAQGQTPEGAVPRPRRGGRRPLSQPPVQPPNSEPPLVATTRSGPDVRFKLTNEGQPYGFEMSILDPAAIEDAKAQVLAFYGDIGIGLTSNGSKAHEEIIKAFQENPKDFAKTLAKVIDRLDEREARALIALDFPDFTKALLTEAENLPDGPAKQKIIKKIMGLGAEGKTPTEQARGFRSASTSIKNELAKIAKADTQPASQDAPPAAEAPVAQPTAEQNKLAEYKAYLKDRWYQKITIADDTPAGLRALISANIDSLADSGIDPDRVPQEIQLLISRGQGHVKEIAPVDQEPSVAPLSEAATAAAAEPEAVAEQERVPRVPQEVYEDIIRILDKLPSEMQVQFLLELRALQGIDVQKQAVKLEELLVRLQQPEVDSISNQIEKRLEEFTLQQQREGGGVQVQGEREGLETLNIRQRESIERVTKNLLNKVTELTGSVQEDSDKLARLVNDGDLNAMIAAITRGNATEKQNQYLRIRGELMRIISQPGDMGAVKDELMRAIVTYSGAMQRETHRSPEDIYNPIDSVQKLAEKIAESQGQELWGIGGVHEIIDKDRNFHPENLILWVREQAIKMHLDNKNDAISPLGSIHIKSGISQISLYEMVRIERQRFMKDEKTGEVLDDLAEQLIIEAWGFGQVRNYDLAYRQSMNQDEKLPDVINQIHARSDLTNGDTFKKLLTMSNNFSEGDIDVGEAVMLTNDLYYNFSDWEQMVKILGGEQYIAQGTEAKIAKLQRETRVALGKLETEEEDKIIRREAEEEISERQKENHTDLSKSDKEKAIVKKAEELKEKKLKALHTKYKKDALKAISGITTFTKEDFEDAIRILQKKRDWDQIDSYEGNYDVKNLYTQEDVDKGDCSREDLGKNRGFYVIKPSDGLKDPSKRQYLFVKDKDTGEEVFNMVVFSDLMNVYNYANPEPRTEQLIRELVRQKSGQRYGVGTGIERDPQKKQEQRKKWDELVEAEKHKGNLTQEDAEKAANREFEKTRYAERLSIQFAENLAEALQRPYGGGARNDTNRKGFDAKAKIVGFAQYLERQSLKERGGPVGIREALGIYWNLGPDMYTALKTENGDSLGELFTEIRRKENLSFADQLKGFTSEVGHSKLLSKETISRLESELAGRPITEINARLDAELRAQIRRKQDVKFADKIEKDIRAKYSKEIKSITGSLKLSDENESENSNPVDSQRLKVIEEKIQQEFTVAYTEEYGKISEAQRISDAEKEFRDTIKREFIKNSTNKLSFASGAEKDIAGNVISRGFQIYHAQTGGDRVEIDELVEWDPVQGVKIHISKFEKVVSDEVIKRPRYLGSTNGGMKWTSTVRRLDPIATRDLGANTYESTSLAEDTYGPEIINYTKEHLAKKFNVPIGRIDIKDMDRLRDREGKLVGPEIINYLDNGTGRLRMAQYGIALDLGAQLLHHRKFRGHAQRWGYVRTEAFIHALEGMKELKLDGKGGTTELESGFFDHELIEIIRKKGHSGSKRLLAEDLTSEMAGPLFSALLEMLTRLGQESFKQAA